MRSDNEETINDELQFRVYSSTGFTFSFWTTNITEPGITKYVIRWGDSTANAESSTAWTSTNRITHSYSVGEKRLTFLIYRGNCVDSTHYIVNVGNIPAGGITGVGGSTICASNAQKFVIAGTKNNSPGTIYEIFYNDGSAKP